LLNFPVLLSNMHFLKPLICFTAFIFFIVCNCHGQDQPLKEIFYKVDTNIRKQVREQDLSEVFGTMMSVKWLDNGKEVPIVSNDKTFGYALYFVNHDTISIILSPVLSPTAGIVIYLKGNKAAIFHRESSLIMNMSSNIYLPKKDIAVLSR
jgi:hypothetical protein